MRCSNQPDILLGAHPFFGKLANRFQHGKSRRLTRLVEADEQALLQESIHDFHDPRRVGVGHGCRGVEREAADEDGEAAEEACSAGVSRS